MVLKMKSISKTFPGVKALDNVTLEAKSGQVLGLIGINGAGKSTLMNILGGLIKQDSGEIIIDDKSVSFSKPKDAEELGISFIHQEPLFFMNLTVAQNIFISKLFKLKKLPFIVDKKQANIEAKKHLEMLGAVINPKLKMEDISIGERQLVEIARALAHESKIIILDEPTSSLSFSEKDKLFEIIRLLKKSGHIIIYISHFLDEINEICDTYLVLRDGKVSGKGLVSEAEKDDFVKMVTGKEVNLYQIEKKEVLSNEILRVENIRSGNLLKDVSFHLNKGEVLGIWGLMGSGRTELLRAIFGLDKSDYGRIYLIEEGRTKKCKPRELLRKCGYVTENRHSDGLFESMPVWKNISSTNLKKYTTKIFSFLITKLEAKDAQHYKELLKIKVQDTKTIVRQLSGGNQQKVILAKWLNATKRIIAMDEPTRGVDVGAKAEIHNLIREAAKKGISVLLVSSEIEEIVSLSDRVVVLKDGIIKAEVNLDDINQKRLLSIALGAGE